MYLFDNKTKNLLASSFEDAFFNYSDFFNFGNGYDVYKNENDTTVIEINVAGFKRDEISISLEGQQLLIKGEKEQTQKKFLKKSISQKFSYTFSVDQSKYNVGASLDDGILKVELNPIKKAKEVKQIEIK